MKNFLIVLLLTGICGAVYFGLSLKKPRETLSEFISEPLVQNEDAVVNVEVKTVFENEEFESQLKMLPNLEDLSKLTDEEAHHAPEIIKDAGERIGRIHQEAQDDPEK